MDLVEAIKGRRSIRKYRTEEIADSVIQEILELARHAPSSMNGQPWHFLVVKGKEAKEILAEIKNRHCPVEKREYRADFIKEASVIIVVCVDRRQSHDRGIENGVLAAGHILLAAHNRGLGGVYMSAYRADEPAVSQDIRQALDIPGHMDPISLIPLGHPDEPAEPKEMKPLRGIVSYEAFGRSETEPG